MAQRILGQGDILSIVEKVKRVQTELGQEELQKQQEKIAKGDFTLEDFRKQFEMLAKMGSMRDLMSNLPGDWSSMIPEGEDPEVSVRRLRGMIDSMTRQERRDPDMIDINRRRRIAAGSGTEPHEVKQFLGMFDQARTLMRQMANMSIMERLKMMTGLSRSGAFLPGGGLPKQKIGTGHRKSPKERAKERKKKKRK
jgi:signal recognition particle subunit SRP54